MNIMENTQEETILFMMQIIKCLIFNMLNKLPEFVQYKFIHSEKFFLKVHKTRM